MDRHPDTATLTFYGRRDCTVCDESRAALQQVLEDRARAGHPVPRVRYLDVDENEALRQSHGARVPVLAAAGRELSLGAGYRQIARFLDLAFGRLA
jgi:peroxiredoxin